MTAPGSTRFLRAAAFVMVLCGAAILAASSRALEPVGDPGTTDDLGPRIVAAEGGPGQNPLSSAAGYGQFLSGTWLELFERAYPTVARTLSRDQILALRDVKPLAEDLTSRYARANAAALRDLGLAATAGELSLAHAIGPGGAVNVLTAEPARPATELLRPEAIAANPIFKGMTADALRRWAAIRVDAPAERSGDASAARPRPVIRLLGPAADFRRNEPNDDPEALVEPNAAATLGAVVEAISRVGGRTGAQLRRSTAAWLLSVGVEPARLLRGDGGAVRIFEHAGFRAVLDAIREVSDRPSFREFKVIATRAAAHGELPRAVLRAVAIALLDKMNQENTSSAKIVQRLRDAAKPQPAAERPVPASGLDAANAGAAVPVPPL